MFYLQVFRHPLSRFSLLILGVIVGLLSANTAKAAECQSEQTEFIVATTLPTSTSVGIPYLLSDAQCDDIVYSGLSAGSGIFQDQSESGFAYSVIAPAGGLESTLSSAVDDAEYLSFSITPNGDEQLNLAGSALRFNTTRIDYHSPRQYAVMTSIDGFGVGNEIYTSARNELRGGDILDLNLPNDERYRSINSTVEIRLYPFGAKFANHNVGLLGFSLGRGLSEGENLPSNDVPYAHSRQIIGTNLGPLSDGSGVLEVVDLMKKSRQFITQDAVNRSAWNSNLYTQMPKDANGYPLEVPFTIDGSPEQQVVTVMSNAKTPVPTGEYLFTYEGEGEFSFIPQRSYRELAPGRGILTVDDTNPQIQLNIRSSQLGNHLRNMKLLIPGYHDDDNTLFTPGFLDSLIPFNVIRYLAWTKTNGSEISTWEQRTTPTSQGQRQGDGVSAEFIISLSNQSNTDPWINIPHMADDDYVRSLAQLYKDRLDPTLNLYVEYSNEIWNNRFIQTHYAREQGQALGFDAIAGGAMNNFYSYRTVQVIQIFEEVFAERKDKIIGVMAGSLPSSWGLDMRLRYNWSDTELSHEDAGVDVVSVAPYFGNSISNSANLDILEDWADHADTYGLDNLFDEIINGGRLPFSDAAVSPLQAMYDSMHAQRLIAERAGLPLVAYEGGQHLVVFRSADRARDIKIEELFFAANRDPRMGEIYTQIFDEWFGMGSGLFANFSHISHWSSSGSWGNIEYLGQPIEETPKHAAVLAMIARLAEQEGGPQPNPQPEPSPNEPTQIIGTNARDQLFGDGNDNDIQGLAGGDLIFSSRGADIINGGDDWDTLNFQNDGGNVVASLQTGEVENTFGERSVISNIEGLVGSDYDDYLTGNGKSNYLNGRSGNDILAGSGGNDFIDGNAGTDTVVLGLGPDDYALSFEDNRTILQSSLGRTTLINVEFLRFSSGSEISLDDYVNGAEVPNEPAPSSPEPQPQPQPPQPQPEPTPEPQPSPTPIEGENNRSIKNYIFGHSLIQHAPRLDLPEDERNEATPETSVPYWMHQLVDANENGHSYALTGQYGFLTGHSDLPPRAHWNYHRERNEPYTWTDWNSSFADADFTDVTITPANFIQHIGPDENYQSARFAHTTPLDETLKIIDWVNEQEPGIKVYIYENWGNLGTRPDVDRTAPIEEVNQVQLHNYHEFVQTEFHDWWVEYFALLRDARPDYDIEMIPVGPIMAKLLNDDRFGLNTISANELYEDVAPHGRPTVYFIASLINYMAMYDQKAPMHIDIPETIHPLITSNYPDIVDYIWSELQSHN